MTRTRTTTISDVAHEAGVALGTVSNVFNHPERVSPVTLKRVMKVADRLGYAPNQNARMLAGGQNRTIALVLTNFKHGISLQIANGANSEAQKLGYRVLMATTDGDKVLARQHLSYFMGTKVSGILMQSTNEHGWEPPLATAPTPSVCLDCHSNENGYFVAADNRAQGRLVAQHALDLGARRIAVFGKDCLDKFALRIQGIRDVMHATGDASFEFIDEGRWDSAREGRTIGHCLATRPAPDRPDFLIALSDVLATGAIAGIQAAGLGVPHDMRVAGCDGNPLAWSGNVPLTSVAPPGYEIGRKGVHYLVAQIEEHRRSANPLPTQNHQALVRPFLLARASSGADTVTDFADPELDISGYL